MRTTLRIEDDLLRELKQQADAQNIPLTRLVNRVLRVGLASLREARAPKSPYRERVIDLGRPAVDLEKALLVASRLEDEEILRKLSLRK